MKDQMTITHNVCLSSRKMVCGRHSFFEQCLAPFQYRMADLMCEESFFGLLENAIYIA